MRIETAACRRCSTVHTAAYGRLPGSTISLLEFMVRDQKFTTSEDGDVYLCSADCLGRFVKNEANKLMAASRDRGFDPDDSELIPHLATAGVHLILMEFEVRTVRDVTGAFDFPSVSSMIEHFTEVFGVLASLSALPYEIVGWDDSGNGYSGMAKVSEIVDA